jgi:four helix bundle protein
MKEENFILEMSYANSLKVIRIAKFMRENKQYDLVYQLRRAGTSIGANVEEA